MFNGFENKNMKLNHQQKCQKNWKDGKGVQVNRMYNLDYTFRTDKHHVFCEWNNQILFENHATYLPLFYDQPYVYAKTPTQQKVTIAYKCWNAQLSKNKKYMHMWVKITTDYTIY